MAQDVPQDSAGPSSPPPTLPEGWLAQWEGVSRKWYYVQRATGKSQWEIPTEPVILTPSTTPTSTGTGPTQTPGPRPQTSSPYSGAPMGDYYAQRGFFGPGTEKAGISSLFSSQGNSQLGGLTQMATGMLKGLGNQILNDLKPSHSSNGQQAQQNHSSQTANYGSTAAYHGTMSSMFQHQPGQNPYGYASTGQSGTYTGVAPQYQYQGQPNIAQAGGPQPQGAFSVPGGHPPQAGTGFPQHYAVDQPNISSQFPPSQPYQHPGSYANQYQSPITASQGGGSAASAEQPQWQAGPAVPQSTKPSVSHPQQTSPNATGFPNQSQYHISSPSYEQHQSPQYANQPVTNTAFAPSQHTSSFGQSQGQSFATHQPPGNSYGHSISEIPGNFQNLGAIQGAMVPSPPVPQHPANPYPQNPQYPQYHGAQHGTPFTPNSATMAASPQGFGSNSPMGNGPPGPLHTAGSQHGSLSHQPSHSSMTNHLTSANQPPSSTGFIAELPDNQPQQQISELPGSEPPRPTQSQTDPQFVSGPWTSPPAGGNPHPQPPRYNQYGGNNYR